MALTQREIRERAVAFAHEWRDASRENAEAQSFWNDFFNIFGIVRKRVAAFEEPVKQLGERRGRIDVFWKGVMLAEHKSRGQNLDKAVTQALDYFPGLKDKDLPKFVLVSDFARFRLYDLEENAEYNFALAELPDRIHLFGFISGYTTRTYQDQDPVNIEVAEKMGELHDALLASGYGGHQLEVLLVRLVYCLFADDTGIFPRDGFRFFLEERTDESGRDTGAQLNSFFQLLDTAPESRQTTLDEDLRQFPHVNGALFREDFRAPTFDRQMRQKL
ncbi:MAG TPA: type IIL restriction-modification enzyme MmeI, partial [Pyrinomonadaceae bacterium]